MFTVPGSNSDTGNYLKTQCRFTQPQQLPGATTDSIHRCTKSNSLYVISYTSILYTVLLHGFGADPSSVFMYTCSLDVFIRPI